MMAPTNAEFLRRAMCEGFLIISLGGFYFQKYRVELFTEVSELVFADKKKF
jgi:hypothetical protein